MRVRTPQTRFQTAWLFFVVIILVNVGIAGAMLVQAQPVPGDASDQAAPPASVADSCQVNVLVFSKTAGFRHTASIPAGITAIQQIAQSRGWTVTAHENSALFTQAGHLDQFDVVVFLSTTGNFLSNAEQTAFENWYRAGGGFVGIHGASNGETGWPWYKGLLGTYFKDHPNGALQFQNGNLFVEDANHPSARNLPSPWQRFEEWYNFVDNPRQTNNVSVVLRVDESSYQGGTMGADHPISWYRLYDGGRTFYTAMGHHAETFNDTLFRGHLEGAIEWASGNCDPGGTLQVTEPTGAITTGYGNPTYRWTHTGAASYEIAVWTGDDSQMMFYHTNLLAGTLCVANVCSFNPVSAVPDEASRLTNGNYNIYVRETNGTWNGPFAFTLNAAPPAVPTMGSATNTNTLRPTVNFTLSGAAANATSFFVFLNQKELHDAGNYSSPAVSDSFTRAALCGSVNSTTCAFTPGDDLMDNTNYSLWIQSSGPGGPSTGGIGGFIGRDFRVETGIFPPAVTAPTGTLTSAQANPAYTWTRTLGAPSFELAVWKADYSQMIFHFTNLPASTYCTTTTCTLPDAVALGGEAARLPDNGVYHTFVQTTGGVWQGPFAFTLNAPAPGTPTMGSVTNTNTLRPTGSFTLGGAAQNATRFWIFVNQKDLHDAGNFATPAVNAYFSRAQLCGTPTGTTCAFTPGVNLLDNTTYYLWVLAMGPGGIPSGGISGWVGSTFRVDTVPDPAVPTITNVTVNEGVPSITFTTDANTTRHTLYMHNWMTNTWFWGVEYVKGGANITCTATTCTVTDFNMSLSNGFYSAFVNGSGPGGVSVGGIHDNGYSNPSLDGAATIEAGDFTIQFDAPALPNMPNASPSSGMLNATWPTPDGTTHYNVWVGDLATFTTYYFGTLTAQALGCTAEGQTCTFTQPFVSLGIPSGTAAVVAVQALGPGGMSSGGTYDNGYAVSNTVAAP